MTPRSAGTKASSTEAEPETTEEDTTEEDPTVEEPEPTDHYVVWDYKNADLLAGPFAEEEQAELAKTELLAKSHQWEEKQLLIETLPH